MTVVTPTNRLKSVRNRCVIERFCIIFLLLDQCIFCRLGLFVIRLRQISSLFSYYRNTFLWLLYTLSILSCDLWTCRPFLDLNTS